MNLQFNLLIKLLGEANTLSANGIANGQELIRLMQSTALASPSSGGANVPYAVDLEWNQLINLAASGSQNFALNALTQPNFGTALNFARIKAIFAYNKSDPVAAPNSAVTLAIATANTAFTLGPGGFCFWVSPDANGILTANATLALANLDAINPVSIGLVLIGAAE